jgi:hypothetical protein
MTSHRLPMGGLSRRLHASLLIRLYVAAFRIIVFVALSGFTHTLQAWPRWIVIGSGSDSVEVCEQVQLLRIGVGNHWTCLVGYRLYSSSLSLRAVLGGLPGKTSLEVPSALRSVPVRMWSVHPESLLCFM